jgi:outer membrane lipoprotein SlyB
MMFLPRPTILLCLALSFGIAGCTRNINSNVYHQNAVGEVSTTYQGNVVQVRIVTVKNEKLEENKAGAMIGAGVGALGGSFIGGGKGNLVSTVGTGIAGGFLGAFVQDKLSTQQAYEIIVKLTNQQIMTIVLVSHDWRSRVIPDTTNMPQSVQPSIPTPNVRVSKSR